MPTPTPPFRQFVADRLRARVRDLTETWLQILADRLPAQPRRIFPGETLLNRIPQLLTNVAAAVGDEPEHQDPQFVREELERLASLRRQQGYGIEELLLEFDILRDVLFDALLEDARCYRGEVQPVEAMAVAARLQGIAGEMGRATAAYFHISSTNERLERARLLTRFGRAVAHELRNRLHSAQLALQLLEQGSANRPELIASMRSALDKSAQVVSDVFAVAVAQDHPSSVEVNREPLSKLVADTLVDLQEFAESRRVTVAACGELPEVQVDASRVQLVLVNLLTNAIKYSDDGKQERTVTVRAAPLQRSGCWRIDVTDNGVGVPPEMQQAIFAEGVRHGDHGDEDGEGLGLALAREAVLQMGGRIWLNSTAGVGSTFSFTIEEPAQGL